MLSAPPAGLSLLTRVLSCSSLLLRLSAPRRDEECEQDHSEAGPWHGSLPPVSPYRCRRQAVLDLLFDDVWQQLVGWMKELVQHQWDCCTLGGCSTRLLIFKNTVIWTP